MYPPTASSRLVLLIMFVVFGWMVEVPRASEILERGLRLRTGRFGRRMLKIAGALKKALRRKKRDGKFQCFIYSKFWNFPVNPTYGVPNPTYPKVPGIQI